MTEPRSDWSTDRDHLLIKAYLPTKLGSLFMVICYYMKNTKELMYCHCGTNNRAPRWTFTDPCKPEVRPGAREESASPAWLAAPAMNARDTTKGIYVCIYDGLTLDVDRHYIGSATATTHQQKRHNNTWVEPLAGNCTTSSTRQREQVWQKCKIQKNWYTVTVAPSIEHHGGHSRTPANQNSLTTAKTKTKTELTNKQKRNQACIR